MLYFKEESDCLLPISEYLTCVAAGTVLPGMVMSQKLLLGKPAKLFQPVCAHENTISRLGGLDLLHPKVVDLAPPYSQCYGHAIRYTNTSKLITYQYSDW